MDQPEDGIALDAEKNELVKATTYTAAEDNIVGELVNEAVKAKNVADDVIVENAVKEQVKATTVTDAVDDVVAEKWKEPVLVGLVGSAEDYTPRANKLPSLSCATVYKNEKGEERAICYVCKAFGDRTTLTLSFLNSYPDSVCTQPLASATPQHFT
ncbi:uncharacterized protein LOC125203144 isoform X1 [Salvia hispanica]|uniref:uncharacterized protein LOC125203104 isoform X1 n=1 Tax=Salvia hispanica TaxID=49212 RepID=UPI0020094270|nr:uncharacterized protein LOC125203104 isoform X1 [Salvia hispanica]XP_047957394.1 uncharacterized protein LOC125203144 isoform X1 [Salvia hispanica]